MSDSNAAHRSLLEELYAAAVAAAMPGPAVGAALARRPMPAGPVHLLAIGKAAAGMAEAALAALPDAQVAGGLVVPQVAASCGALRVVPGDHPVPGAHSRAAADALGEAAARVRPGETVWVLLSGGASSLVGAPVEGVAADDLAALGTLLLGSGLDIAAMNAVRRRFARWGAGRLAAALAPAGRVLVLAISDVPGDDPAVIASGPCSPDPLRAADVRQRLDAAGLLPRVPAALRRHLDETDAGRRPETPKPGDPCFAHVEIEIVAGNRIALEGAARLARERGWEPEVRAGALAGAAAAAGERLARELLEWANGSDGECRCLIAGGETTVTLGAHHGAGGRSQELALAAARVLAGHPDGPVLLAAGTDGRDGPTDAAGAVVDATTWTAIAETGRDPAAHLARHDAYAALDAAGALLRPGLTGTNVMDVVIAVAPPAAMTTRHPTIG